MNLLPCAPRAVALALALLASGLALAEQSPYYAGASASVTRDSNVYRARSGSEQSDTVTATGLRLGLDQTFGRQRAIVDASADHLRYSRANDLNHNEYALTGRLDWETIERLSGLVAASSSQTLYRDTSRTSASQTLLRTQNATFQARLGVVTQWSFDAGASAGRTRYSSSAYRSSNLDQQAYSAGVRYSPSPDLSTRVGLRHTNGEYPNYSSTRADEIRRNDIDLGLTLRPSGASTLDMQLSRTRETHSVVTVRDTSSWTGALGWNWKASGKSSISARLSRDSSVGAYGDLGLAISDTSDARQRDALSLSTRWEATGKLRIDTSLGYARRTLDDALVSTLTSTAQRTRDTTTSVGLGLTYTPLRNVELGCALNWENREVSNESSTLTYPYSVTTVRCQGEMFLR